MGLRHLLPLPALVAMLGCVAPPAASAAPASTALAGVAGSGVWATAFGGSSVCRDVGTAGVACEHSYSSADLVTGIDSCVGSMAVATGGPSLTIINQCHAALSGVTSGTGRVVGETAGACVTRGLLTGTVTFADSTGTSYPAVPVTIVNDAGSARFFGAYVNAARIVVAKSEGTFTMGCGGPAGSFVGEYSLL